MSGIGINTTSKKRKRSDAGSLRCRIQKCLALSRDALVNGSNLYIWLDGWNGQHSQGKHTGNKQGGFMCVTVGLQIWKKPRRFLQNNY